MDFNLKSMIRSVNPTWPTSSLQPTPRVVIGYGISRVDIVGFYLALSAVEVAKKHRRSSHKNLGLHLADFPCWHSALPSIRRSRCRKNLRGSIRSGVIALNWP